MRLKNSENLKNRLEIRINYFSGRLARRGRDGFNKGKSLLMTYKCETFEISEEN